MKLRRNQGVEEDFRSRACLHPQHSTLKKRGPLQLTPILCAFVMAIALVSQSSLCASIQQSYIKTMSAEVESGKSLIHLGEMQMVSLNSLYGSVSNATLSVTFREPKQMVAAQNLFYCMQSLEINLDVWTIPYLHFEINPTTLAPSSTLTLEVSHWNASIASLVVRYFVVDSVFADSAYILASHQSVNNYSPSNDSPLISDFEFPSDSMNPNAYAAFLTSVTIMPKNNFVSSTDHMGVYLFESHSISSIEITVKTGDGTRGLNHYNHTVVGVIIMTIYKNELSGAVEYEFLDVEITLPEFGTSSQTFQDFFENQTALMIGLQTFRQSKTFDIIVFDCTQTSSSEFRFSTTTLRHTVFRVFGFNAYSDTIGCFDPSYPIEREIAGQTRCHDSCLEGEYLAVNLAGDYECMACPSECVTCASSNKCTSCSYGHELVNQTDLNGLPVAQLCGVSRFYTHNDSAAQELILCRVYDAGCLECTDYVGSSFNCTKCAEHYYFIEAAINICRSCSLFKPGCLDCNATVCYECQAGYTQTDNDTCVRSDLVADPSSPNISDPSNLECSDSERCKYCHQTNSSHCLECVDSNMTLEGGVCSIPCGDGRWSPELEDCDDGNQYDFDGCSSECEWEDPGLGFECENRNVSLLQPSDPETVCRLQKSVQLSLKSLNKVTTLNRLEIELELSEPLIRHWELYLYEDLSQLFEVSLRDHSDYWLTCDFTFRRGSQSSDSGDQSDLASRRLQFEQSIVTTHHSERQMRENFGFIFLELSYGISSAAQSRQFESLSTLNHQTAVLSFSPKSSGLTMFSAVPTFNLSFELLSQNNQNVQYFTSSYYQLYDFILVMATMVSATAFLMLAISFLFLLWEGGGVSTLILIDFAAVSQLTFWSIAFLGELNPLFVALAEGLGYVGYGFDLFGLDEGESSLNRSWVGVGFKSGGFAQSALVPLALVITTAVTGALMKGVALGISKSENDHKESQKEDVIEEQATEIRSSSGQPPQLWERLDGWGSTLAGHLSFSILIFFAYGLSVGSVNSLLNSESASTLDIGLVGCFLAICLTFALLIVFKPSIFCTLTQKLTGSRTGAVKGSTQSACQQSIAKSFNKKLYLIALMAERLLSGCCLVSLSSFAYAPAAQILLLVLLFGLVIKARVLPFAQKIRFALIELLAIAILSLILYRKVATFESLGDESVGRAEDSVSQYIPVTITVLLIVGAILTLTYFFYSFKPFRLFTLECQKSKRQSTKSSSKIEKPLSDQIHLHLLNHGNSHQNNAEPTNYPNGQRGKTIATSHRLSKQDFRIEMKKIKESVRIKHNGSTISPNKTSTCCLKKQSQNSIMEHPQHAVVSVSPVDRVEYCESRQLYLMEEQYGKI